MLATGKSPILLNTNRSSDSRHCRPCSADFPSDWWRWMYSTAHRGNVRAFIFAPLPLNAFGPALVQRINSIGEQLRDLAVAIARLVEIEHSCRSRVRASARDDRAHTGATANADAWPVDDQIETLGVEVAAGLATLEQCLGDAFDCQRPR